MAILVFLLSWFISTTITDRPEVGFLVAVLATLVYRQGKRLDRLELELKTLHGAAAPSDLIAQKSTSVSEKAPRAAAAEESSRASTIAAKDPRAASSAGESVLEIREPARFEEPTPQPTAAPPGGAILPPREPRTTTQVLESVLGATIAGFVTKGNPIARVGVVILFFGVVFLLKFAAEQGFIPIELRLVGAALGACALLAIGWRKRDRRPQIALTLQGAGAGVFYITTFIAFRLYDFIPGPLAFAFLVTVTVLTALLAVLQNARALAVLGIIGGFLAPALTSEGGGNHVLLFSYLSILNLGIFGICWFRSWRAVNLTGFLFTFVLSSLWGATSYRPEYFASTEPFLLFFLVMYSTINVLFAKRTASSAPGAVDAIMTFGTPFFAMFLQYGLVHKFEYGMAISAATFGAFHVALARYTFSADRARLRFLTESYLAVGVAFLTLAIPFAVSSRLTSAVWALEALALIWSGTRQRHFLTRFGGHLVLVLSGVSFALGIRFGNEDIPFLNPYFIGIFLLTLGLVGSAALLLKAQTSVIGDTERRYAFLYLIAGLLCWFSGGYTETARYISDWNVSLSRLFPTLVFYWIPFGIMVDSLFVSSSIFCFWALARRYAVQQLSNVRLLLVPVHVIFFGLLLIEAFRYTGSLQIHPANSFGCVSWIFFFFVHYRILRDEEKKFGDRSRFFQHSLALWLATALLAWEVYWLGHSLVQGGAAWRLSALTLIPAIVLLTLQRSIWRTSGWPFAGEGARVYSKALSGIALWLFLWPLYLNLSSSASARPLPFMPLLNPLDVAQAVAVLAILAWWSLRRAKEAPPISHGVFSGLLGASLFVWSTALLFRSAHHYMAIPWRMESLLDSSFVQSALSIYWSALALVLMLLAHAKSWRPVWKFGAFLIAIVVVKLLVVDMSNQGTVARIAAFMGVGLLMLTIGYFAPIPPPKNISKE